MGIAFPGESAEYRAARDRLLEQEIELRRAMEAVAAARRELPPGGAVPEDYVFQGAGADGAPTDVRLSELFAPGKDSLVIYSFMFPRDPGDERPGPEAGRTALLPLAEGPCPSCVALLDQLDGAAEHAGQHLNLAVVAKSPLPRILTFAEERGWRRLRLLSSAGNTYNRDYLGETAEGAQRPMLNVFHRDGGDDPPLLGLGALLRTDRARTGSPPRRHPRAGLEPVRPDPRGPPGRLGRAAELRIELRVTAIVGRTLLLAGAPPEPRGGGGLAAGEAPASDRLRLRYSRRRRCLCRHANHGDPAGARVWGARAHDELELLAEQRGSDGNRQMRLSDGIAEAGERPADRAAWPTAAAGRRRSHPGRACRRCLAR